MIILLFKDIGHLITILAKHNGFKTTDNDNDSEEIDKALKIQIYNEIRATVISLYTRL